MKKITIILIPRFKQFYKHKVVYKQCKENCRIRNIQLSCGDYTIIRKTDPKNAQTENNNLCITQSVVLCGI